MDDILHIEWPWEMIYIEYADQIEAQIKKSLPPDHELRRHKLFPEIKWDKRPRFIVHDDTTGERMMMNFEKMKRWKKTRYKVPTIEIFRDSKELADMIRRDHLAECAKYNDDGSLK